MIYEHGEPLVSLWNVASTLDHPFKIQYFNAILNMEIANKKGGINPSVDLAVNADYEKYISIYHLGLTSRLNIIFPIATLNFFNAYCRD